MQPAGLVQECVTSACPDWMAESVAGVPLSLLQVSEL